MVLIVSSSKILPGKPFMQPLLVYSGYHDILMAPKGQMSPQLRSSVPVPSLQSILLTLPLNHSDFTPECRPMQVTLGASAQDTLFDGCGQGWGGAEGLQGRMSRTPRESSRRLDSTYPQKAHNEERSS